jgi:hypothetical protein
MTVSINPPKTPVTEGSSGIAAATLPNVCKMPGPPAPFVPTPLPNIGKSDNLPDVNYELPAKVIVADQFTLSRGRRRPLREDRARAATV